MPQDIGKRKSCIDADDRLNIQEWRKKRQKKMAARKSYFLFYLSTFNLETLQSFAQNINLMVIIQMVIAGVSVYIFQKYGISFDLHVTLFVSPIVFPLAFSINTDFQRREKVLEDLAQFKSSGMVWYFCMRDWKTAAQLDNDWIAAVHAKLRSLLFHLREYLLTYKIDRRKVILRAVYEDFSDTNQLIEKLRASKLPSNTAIISRSIHLLNMMCLSFERLRVIREYRSPRSIRSFNKVLIMFLPIILSPYFVYLGEKSKNKWEPYFISILVAFVFSALQGVQDKLDDPFDGMSEDDIHLDSIDEWNSSLEHTMKKTFAVGLLKKVRSSIDERDSLLMSSKKIFGFRNSKDYNNINEEGNVEGNNRISTARSSCQLDVSPINSTISINSNRNLDAIFEPVTLTDANGDVAPPDSCTLHPIAHPTDYKSSDRVVTMESDIENIFIDVPSNCIDSVQMSHQHDVRLEMQNLLNTSVIEEESSDKIIIQSDAEEKNLVKRFCKMLNHTQRPFRHAYKNAASHLLPCDITIFNGILKKKVDNSHIP